LVKKEHSYRGTEIKGKGQIHHGLKNLFENNMNSRHTFNNCFYLNFRADLSTKCKL